MKGTFTFLGTSASVGVPLIGCKCHVCKSNSPFNKRLRPAALIELSEKKVLLDVGPDYYQIALKHEINHLDALLLTHTHYDHIAGLDDLRVYTFFTKKPLVILCSKETEKELKQFFSYLFETPGFQKFQIVVLDENKNSCQLFDAELNYVFYSQIGMNVTGYRIGDLAFITDIKEYDKKIFSSLRGLSTLIISAINWSPTRAHLGIEEVIEIAKELKPKSVLLTHIGHELDYEETNKKLPPYIKLAYDGMKVDFNY